MLDREPRPIRILAVLAVLAFGFAMLANFGFAKLLQVDPARLAAVKAGQKPAAAAVADAPDTSSDGDAVATADPERKSSSSGPKRLDFFRRPIVDRNLFNSAANPQDLVEVGPTGTEVQKSELDVVLVSTSPTEPVQWSTAFIAVQTDAAEAFQIGEEILDAKITDIFGPWLDANGLHRPARIHVNRGGQEEYVEVGGEKKSKARKVSAKSDDDKKKKPARKGRHTWDGIKDCGENKYCVEQGEIDYALANLDKMAREARVVPNFSDGQTNGFKVFSIRRNSALRKMGLKNNDVLTSVNGFDLSNTEKALEIYSKLQSDKNFQLEILRNGSPVTLEYNVQ